MSELTEEMIDEFFAKNLAGKRDEPQEEEATPDDMRALYASWNTQHDLNPGDIVKLKPGMQGFRNVPRYDKPCVVMELIDPMKYPDALPNNPYFGAILDIVIGFITSDGDLLFLHCDRRQFEPFE